MLARITIQSLTTPYDDYFRDGAGPDYSQDPDIERVIEIDSDFIADLQEYHGADISLDGAIEYVLRDEGLDQWDGGNTAYDPDGAHMSYRDGDMTERWAHVERFDD